MDMLWAEDFLFTAVGFSVLERFADHGCGIASKYFSFLTCICVYLLTKS
jgi:hypothetical protein